MELESNFLGKRLAHPYDRAVIQRWVKTGDRRISYSIQSVIGDSLKRAGMGELELSCRRIKSCVCTVPSGRKPSNSIAIWTRTGVAGAVR